MCQWLNANWVLAVTPISAVVERHPVTSCPGKSGDKSLHAGVSRRAQAAKRPGWARGRLDARGVGTVAGAVLAGAGSARGRRTAFRGRTQPCPAPPRPALPCSVLPVPSRSVPPARSSHPPRAEAPAGVASAAMAQHFSLASCDVVGFDLDHTLCRYNLPESAPVSGAGCPGLRACSLHGGWGWSSLLS